MRTSSRACTPCEKPIADRFETIEATLRAGFPGFERLNFPPVAAGTLAMTWKDKTSKNPFYMHQLSEGTLRFLWLATLLQSPGLTARHDDRRAGGQLASRTAVAPGGPLA